MQNVNKNVMYTDAASGLSKPTQLTDWKGQNAKISAVWPDSTVAQTQINLRMRVIGELQRRNGMASSNVAQQASAILGLIPVAAPSGTGILVVPSNGTVIGSTTPPKALWSDALPLIPIGNACTLFNVMNDSGTTSKQGQLNPPPNCCAGTITFQSIEAVHQGAAYGYQVTIECFDAAGLIVTYTSACLINQTVPYVLPAGTTNVSYDVTGNCNGGGTPGTWGIAVSTP